MAWLPPRWMLDEVVDAVAATVGWSRAEDCRAASMLEELLWQAYVEGRYTDPEELCRPLQGRRACVAGAAETLPRDMEAAGGCEAFVAADGAAEALLGLGIVPDVIVSDLDSRWSILLDAARLGSVVVVHLHADNMAYARSLVPQLRRVTGTHQCPARATGLALPPLGFTDGDKAVGLALACGARELVLAGMDTSARVGPWSKPWLRGPAEPWWPKTVKLATAELLIRVYLESSGLSYSRGPGRPSRREEGR